MKNKKSKLFFSLSFLIICFLLSTSTLNTLSSKALLEDTQNSFSTDSFDRSTWKWNKTEVISEESTATSTTPSLVVDSFGNVHIVWSDNTNYQGSGTDYDIFYKNWTSSTSSWSTAAVITTDSSEHSYDPSIAVHTNGDIHIAWSEYYDMSETILYKAWVSSFSYWTQTYDVAADTFQYSGHPSLAVDLSGIVHVVWRDDETYGGATGTMNILYTKSDSYFGYPREPIEGVSTESTQETEYPSLAIDSSGNIHVVWADETDLDGGPFLYEADIFYKRWNSSTSSWTTTEIVSSSSFEDSYDPSITTDNNGNVHVTWYEDDNSRVYYRRWEASTTSWSTKETVYTSTADLGGSSHTIDSEGDLHLTWHDSSNYAGSGTDFDIFYKLWNSSISSWTTTEVISTVNANSLNPSLAIDSTGHIHIAWEDLSNYEGSGTDLDVFYTRTILPPASAPELSFIVPNPTEISTVNLDWNDIDWANTYFVYRSTSYIWSIEDLSPISTVYSSNYTDIVPSEGFYYYVVVAGNFGGNTTYSNCQYVEVKFSELEAPELAFVLPNPISTDSISLVWDSIDDATEYYVYRSDTYIWSVAGLTPIATVGSNFYTDTLPDEGFYFYVIVANDGVRNSTHSNCEYIQYKLPTLQEFTIVTSLILGTFVVIFVVMRIRKKKPKPN